MKTQLTLPQKRTFRTLSCIGVMMLTLFAFNPIYGQTAPSKTSEDITNQRTVKGIVIVENAPLEGVNIVKKGTKIGTVTNEKGEFTFPAKLDTGDILVFSYLGYEKQEREINDTTTFIELELTEDSVVMIGALDSAKPYKSKRKN